MADAIEASGESSCSILITAPAEYPRIRINKWRVREGYPVGGSQVILLYEAINDTNDDVTNKTVHKMKASQVGVVKKRFFKEGEIVEHGAAILELSKCVHTTVIKDMCADCGADLRQNENLNFQTQGNISEASVPMIHSVPDLKVTQKLAQKLGHDDTRRLLQDRKLVLLVDLDQTVIHTTNDNVPNNIKSIYHFQLYGPHSPWYHTRLRPGTPQFLESMSKFYELHICTFGARNYAHMIAQLLDPEGKFFSHRILSRDECFNATSKTDNLKALFPNGDSMVCIIDDREDVWNMASNLIQVKPYHFFQHTGDINAPPGLSKHELDGEGVDFKDMSNLTVDKDKEKDSEAESKVSDCDDTDTATKASEESDLKSDEADSIADTDTTSATNTNESDEVSCSKDDEPTTTTATTTATIISVEELEEVTEAVAEAAAESAIEIDVAVVVSTEEEEKAEVTSTTDKTSANEQPTQSKDAEQKSDVETDSETPSSSAQIKLPSNSQNQIEIEDADDYLLYLEVILKNIHSRFYDIYDKTQEIPDLKIIVPKIRSEVLRGLNLIFSGLVPTNMKLEQSRAYFIAKSLGANVSQNISAASTHLVAVTSGTFKVNAAKKNPQIKVVNANWLWSCAERWERVDERLYPLDRKTKSKQRQPPAHCHSPEHVVNYSEKSEISVSSSAQQQSASEPEKFVDTINPLLSFSYADLADMNKEYDQFFESDSSSEDEHVNIENPPVDKSLRKRKRDEEGEERTRDFFTRSENVMLGAAAEGEADDDPDVDAEGSSIECENEDDEEDDMPSAKFRRGEQLPSDLEIGSDSNDDSDNNPDNEDDGDWNMMGAALEREFLGLED